MSTTRLASPKAQATETPRHRAALLLVAHGVRGGPGIAAQHAVAMRRLGLFDEIAVACLKGEPEIGCAVRSLHSPEIFVLPLLMAKGYSYDTVLRDQLRGDSPGRRVTVCEPLGLDPALAGIACEMAIKTCRERSWSGDETAVTVVGHGTRQSMRSRASAVSMADQLRRRGIFDSVNVAFLEDEPCIADLLARASGRKSVLIGLFADRGVHGEGDLERLAGVHGSTVAYAGPIGADPRIGGLIAGMALSAAKTLSHFPEKCPIVA
jgi:sirohydrochlorin ferrochelatase